MGRDCEKAWPLLALLLLTACGGGGDTAPSVTQEKPGSIDLRHDTNLVVVRYDWDRDAHPDVLTLDTSRNPLVIVEAIRGTADGSGTDATDLWRGRPVEADVNDPLQLHLARSCSVGSQTDLELIVDGVPVTVTVIE